MNRKRAAVLLLIVQLALVLSVAGKYLYERRTRPRLWSRATQLDPGTPLRGRYLRLRLLVDACGLPHDARHFSPGMAMMHGAIGPANWRWKVTLHAVDGRILPRAEEDTSLRNDAVYLSLPVAQPCDRAPLEDEEFFVSDKARLPFPQKTDEELWVEVTMPESGPPRPIQLAVSRPGEFRVLELH